MVHDIQIVPGNMARASLEEALSPRGKVLVADYALSYGPLLQWQSIGEWERCREEYWRSLHPSQTGSSRRKGEAELVDNIDLIRSASSIVLWIGTSPDEQLLLVWMVQFLRAVDLSPEQLRVVQFDREPRGGFEVVGLGELEPDQLRAHPALWSLTIQQIAEIDRTWAAVTAPDPGELVTLLGEERADLPLLRRSLKALVFRFPAVATGLNRWEEQLLRYTEEKGPAASRVIAYTLVHSFDPPDSVGEVYLFGRMRRLAACSQPFILLTGSDVSHRGSEVRLTDAGAKALAGGKNFVTLNGVDDWIGGVHLDSSKTDIWFRRDNAIVRA